MPKLEWLPNEILIECFEYLGAIDIFHSFDGLNLRFYDLIRRIPLKINLQYVKKSALISFCQEVSSNVQLKNRIQSLKIPKKSQFNAVTQFFSSVSLNELTELQAFTFIGSNTETIDLILPTLPLLTKLKCFRVLGSSSRTDEILTSLPTSNIQTLLFETLYSSRIRAFTSLVNLTISRCTVEELCAFFTHAPMLQYSRIRYIGMHGNSPDSTDQHAIYLKRLIINAFKAKFSSLEILLKRTPNLKSLSIASNRNEELFGACRWQHLITTALPHLNIFKFKFGMILENENDIVDKFLSFQTGFWHQQHHWYTEYKLNNGKGHVYTIPYMSNRYEIRQITMRYFRGLNSSMETFTNVTDLTLNLDVMNYTDAFYFPNVKSLRLVKGSILEGENTVEYLKRLVALCGISHLEISSKCTWDLPSNLLQILKETVNLSSLKIGKKILVEILNHPELCNYLGEVIKKLDINDIDNEAIADSEMKKLCQTFVNLEELRYHVGWWDNLQMILIELSKSSSLKIFSYKTHHTESGYTWLEEHKSQFDSYRFFIECDCS